MEIPQNTKCSKPNQPRKKTVCSLTCSQAYYYVQTSDTIQKSFTHLLFPLKENNRLQSETDLYRLGDQQQASGGGGRRRLGHHVEHFRVDDGGTDQAKEHETAADTNEGCMLICRSSEGVRGQRKDKGDKAVI